MQVTPMSALHSGHQMITPNLCVCVHAHMHVHKLLLFIFKK